MQSTTVVGGPHDGKRIALAAERMVLRTSSGVYMRHADRPEYLFHVPSLLTAADLTGGSKMAKDTDPKHFLPDEIKQVIRDRIEPTMDTEARTVSMDEDDRGRDD